MTKVSYFTLADVRREDPVAFDAAIKQAIKDAVSDVGSKVAIQAFCYQKNEDSIQIDLAA